MAASKRAVASLLGDPVNVAAAPALLVALTQKKSLKQGTRLRLLEFVAST